MAKYTWLVPKESLEAVVTLLENVPTRNRVLSSEFIKVSKAGKDGATFHLASVLYGKALLRTGEEFPFDRDLFLDRRLFIPFVQGGRESKATDYMFIGNDSQLSVRHGNRRAVYTYAQEIAGYEEPKDIDKANSTKIQKKLTQMIDCASNCATDDPITPTINCIYVRQAGKVIEAMSTNQLLVFYGRVTTDKHPLKDAIAFPLGLVQALRQEGAIKLLWNHKLALVEFPKGKIWQAVKTAARKSFPHKEIKAHVKKALSNPQICSVASGVFAKAADRLSSYTAALDSADLALEICLTKGSKKVQLKAGVADSLFTELFYSISEAKDDVILEWPIAQVMPILMFGKDEGNFRIHLAKTGESALVTKNMILLIGARTEKKKKKRGK